MKKVKTNFERVIYRNVYLMENGRMYESMNVYHTEEDALILVDKHGEKGDQYVYTYSTQVHVCVMNDDAKV